MTTQPPELIRSVWAAEEDSHRRELAQSLAAVEKYLSAARSALAAGTVDTRALRQLATDALAAAQEGAALAAVERVRFALPGKES